MLARLLLREGAALVLSDPRRLGELAPPNSVLKGEAGPESRANADETSEKPDELAEPRLPEVGLFWQTAPTAVESLRNGTWSWESLLPHMLPVLILRPDSPALKSFQNWPWTEIRGFFCCEFSSSTSAVLSSLVRPGGPDGLPLHRLCARLYCLLYSCSDMVPLFME